MRLVSAGRRSSVWEDGGGALFRLYSDTGAVAPLPTRIDERGRRRFARNATTPRPTFSSFRGGGEGPAFPAYLARARQAVFASEDIDGVARRCGVRRSTAWSYVTQLAEWEDDVASHALSSSFLCPELVVAFFALGDTTGPLSAVMQRLAEGPLRGCAAWRCEEDRYAQVRLLRVAAFPDGAEKVDPPSPRGPERWTTPSSAARPSSPE